LIRRHISNLTGLHGLILFSTVERNALKPGRQVALQTVS
jgi:hypothetical protein